MRHVWRDGQALAGIHDDLFTINPELQRARGNVCELLIRMTVLRHNASFLQQDARQHDILSNHEMAPQQRI